MHTGAPSRRGGNAEIACSDVACSDSHIYLSMASLSGPEREYKQPLGGEVPGRRSMAQS